LPGHPQDGRGAPIVLGPRGESGVISRDEAHVWLADPEALGEELTKHLSVLSADERTRMARFRFEHDRVAYGTAHLLLRAALTWCAPDVPSANWDLTALPHERPEVLGPKVSPRLRFNLSHTRGLVACLVACEIDCGIDVELRRQVDELEALARKVLSPAERSDLAALPDELRPTRFFDYWTLKEAYVKARGKGLSLPLDAVSFDLSGGDIGITFGESLSDQAADWQFEHWTPTEHHVVAVAVRSGPTRNTRIVRHAAIPLPLAV
jgi:4'-phosphopantetheinyl transferase